MYILVRCFSDQLAQMQSLNARFQEKRLQKLAALEEELKSETEELLLHFDTDSDMAGYVKV